MNGQTIALVIAALTVGLGVPAAIQQLAAIRKDRQATREANRRQVEQGEAETDQTIALTAAGLINTALEQVKSIQENHARLNHELAEERTARRELNRRVDELEAARRRDAQTIAEKDRIISDRDRRIVGLTRYIAQLLTSMREHRIAPPEPPAELGLDY